MLNDECNNNAKCHRKFVEPSRGLWSRYEFTRSQGSPVIVGRSRARSLCEPYSKLIDSKSTLFHSSNALQKYPSDENVHCGEATAFEAGNHNKENASAELSTAKSHIVKKWMALNASFEHLKPAKTGTVAEIADTNLKPCNFDQGLSVSTMANAMCAVHSGVACKHELETNTADPVLSSPKTATMAVAEDATRNATTGGENDTDKATNKCIVRRQKKKITELRRDSIKLERLDVKLELLKSKANTMK